MKKVKYIIAGLIIIIIFSCNNDDKPVFDQSAAERLKSRIEEDQNILTNAENGWITDYRPDDQFGYFKLWFQFNKDGTVHTLSDIPLVNHNVGRGGIFAPHHGFYKDTTTHYRVSSQHSVDLVFEDPMALHYLYSLTNRKGQEFKSGAEFEFYITRATSEEVVLESKTDRGKGEQKKTQIILKKAVPEDKEKIKKSYAEWERLSSANMPYVYLSDTLDDGIELDIEKRIGGAGKFPVTEVFPYHIKVKKDKDHEAIYSQVIVGNQHTVVLTKEGMTEVEHVIVIPKGGLPEVKFAESGKPIGTSKVTLEKADKNQVGVYDNAILSIGNVKSQIKKLIVYDPSITGEDIAGRYFGGTKTKAPKRIGTISLVDGTNNIFLATNFGYYNKEFPVYFQMNGSKASVIQQTYVFTDIARVKLDWDTKHNIMEVFIRDQDDEQTHPSEPDYGYHFKFHVYNPSITGDDMIGSYYNLEKPERTGTISLVEGTNIFLATDFGYYNKAFPVYFQMKNHEALVIPQTYAYDDIIRVALDWDYEKKIMTVFVRNQDDEQTHPSDPDYGYHFKFHVYNPSITGDDMIGSYYNLEKPERTGTISLVEGTNIFLATDFGYYNKAFPVYFQMKNHEALVIPQTYAYDDIVRVALDWDYEKKIMIVFVRNQDDEQTHPSDPDYGYYFKFQLE